MEMKIQAKNIFYACLKKMPPTMVDWVKCFDKKNRKADNFPLHIVNSVLILLPLA